MEQDGGEDAPPLARRHCGVGLLKRDEQVITDPPQHGDQVEANRKPDECPGRGNPGSREPSGPGASRNDPLCPLLTDALRAPLADGRVDRAGGADRPATTTAAEQGVSIRMAVADRGARRVILGHADDGIRRVALSGRCILENGTEIGRQWRLDIDRSSCEWMHEREPRSVQELSRRAQPGCRRAVGPITYHRVADRC